MNRPRSAGAETDTGLTPHIVVVQSPGAGRWRQLMRVFRDRQLRRLQASFAVFALAENATWIAVTVYAFRRGGVGEAGVVSAVQLAPAVAVAPLAAYAGDRFRRDVVLALGYLAQSMCMLATAAAMWRDAPGVIVYAAATSTAVAVTFTRPTIGALLPAATHTPADLTAANVALGIVEHLGVFLGPAAAAALLQGAGDPMRVFAVMGAASAVAAAAVSRLHLDPAMVVPQRDVDAGDVVHDVFGGFRTLRLDADLRALLMVMALSPLLLGASDVLFVVVADNLFDQSSAGAGALAAACGFGGVLGAAGSIALVGRSRLAASSAAAIVAAGAAFALIGAMPRVAPVFALFIAVGAGLSVARVAGATLLQRVTPSAVLSRVFGVMEGLQMAALAVGAVAVSVLVNGLGMRAGLIVLGLVAPAALATKATRLLHIDRAAPRPRPALVRLVTDNPIFANLAPPTLERLLLDVETHELPAGTVVVRQGDEGDEGDRYYFVERGELTVTVDDVPSSALGAGSGFGEIALLSNVPRTATVTATTPVLVHTVRRAEFLAALSGHPGGLRVAHEQAQRLLDHDVTRFSASPQSRRRAELRQDDRVRPAPAPAPITDDDPRPPV